MPKTLTADEAHALLDQPNLAAPTGLRDRVMLELMYRSGLRVSEVCGLALRDHRARDGQIHLRADVAKGGREAFVYVDGRTAPLLERWKIERRRFAAGQPHLLTTLKGGPVSRTSTWEMVVRRASRAGIRHAHPHMLRHTYATDLLRDGFNIREVQVLMRHADIRTTAIYLEIADMQLEEKFRARGR